MSIRLNRAMHEGIGETAKVYAEYSPNQAPFLPLSASFLYFIFPMGTETALVVNSVFIAVLLLSVYFFAAHFNRPVEGLVAAIALVAIRPVMEYARMFRTETALTALVALTMLCLVKSERFRKIGWSLGAGAAAGAALLTNGIAAVYLAGGVIYVAARTVFGRKISFRQVALLAAFVVVTLGLAATWYGPNLKAIWSYLTDFGFGSSAESFGAGGGALSLDAWLYYPKNIYDAMMLPLVVAFAATAAAAIVFVIRRARGPRAVVEARGGATRFDIWLPVVWAASCYILISIPRDKKIHFALTFLPPLVLLMAHLLSKIDWKIARTGCVVLIFAGCAVNFAFVFSQPQFILRDEVMLAANGREMWKLGAIADEIARASEGRKETTVAFLANHAVFQAKAFELEALKRGHDFRVEYVSMANSAQIYSAIEKSDFVIAKTGTQLGVKEFVIDPASVRSAISLLEAKRGWEYKEVATFGLPDGEAILWMRIK
jgi:4-amino-4-deoxy-L-arabinose transferase-like glycosyltransferase